MLKIIPAVALFALFAAPQAHSETLEESELIAKMVGSWVLKGKDGKHGWSATFSLDSKLSGTFTWSGGASGTEKFTGSLEGTKVTFKGATTSGAIVNTEYTGTVNAEGNVISNGSWEASGAAPAGVWCAQQTTEATPTCDMPELPN